MIRYGSWAGRPWVLFVPVALAFVGLAAEAAWTNAVAVDEFAFVPSGVAAWERGEFSLFQSNPPLVKSLVALPAWLAGARMDYSRAGQGYRTEMAVGGDFLRVNAPRTHGIFFRARLVSVGLSLLCGLAIYAWVLRLHGEAPAAVCATLWLTDPNVVAHSSLATADCGGAAFGCLAAYTLWRYLAEPSWSWALAAGVSVGLAQAAKQSMLSLNFAWPVVIIGILVTRVPPVEKPTKDAILRTIVPFALVGWAVLCASYEFDGCFRPLGSYGFRSRLLTGIPAVEVPSRATLPPSGNRFSGTALAWLPVPVPEDHLLGIDSILVENEARLAHMEGGRLVRGGRWSSWITTWALKLPPGTLLLACAGALGWLAFPGRPRLGGAVLAAVALSQVVPLCTSTGLNWAIRYSLPLLAWTVVGLGPLVAAAWARPVGRIAVLACLAWNLVSLVSVRPFYLSYANELAGGPEGAQSVFLGSNYDWGIDLRRLKRWDDTRTDGLPLALTYYGVDDPEALGLRRLGLPLSFRAPRGPGGRRGPEEAAPAGFYWAISSNALNGLSCWNKLEDGMWLFGKVESPRLTPENAIARIGYSLYIFRIGGDAEGRGQTGRPIAQSELTGCVLNEVNAVDATP